MHMMKGYESITIGLLPVPLILLQVDAIRTIDETLMKRGHSQLILGQPVKPKKRKKLSDFTSLAGEKVPGKTGIAKGYKTSAMKTSQPGSEDIMGHSLITSNPTQSEAKVSTNTERQGARLSGRPNNGYVPYAVNKFATQGHPMQSARVASSSSIPSSRYGVCEVCGQSPYHMPAQCSTIAQGPKRCGNDN